MSFGRSSSRSSRRPARFTALPPPSGEVSLGFVTLHNTGASAVEPRARLGLAWRKGRFPGTHRVRVRRWVDGAPGPEAAFAAIVSPNRWSDGSVKTTADGGLVFHDTEAIPAGGSRTYQVYATGGAQPVSGFDPWAWIDAHANDFTVEVTSRTGSQSGAMGDLAYSLKAAIANPARREIVADTARFVRVKVWQLPAGEGHLVCEWHLDFWLDASGVPVAVEWTTVMCLDWFVADPLGSGQPKQRQNYDATVRYGTTAVDTRTGLQHAYHCRWASLRSANDPQHARKHWVDLSGTDPLPTVRVEYPLATLREMMRAGAVPPIRQDLVPTLSSDVTYVPFGNHGHRAHINGTGAYAGRGVWSLMDCDLLIHQAGGGSRNPNRAWRNSRANAQSGLAAFFHARDHRPVDGEIRRRLIPWPMRQITGGTQAYPGLATPVVHTRAAIAGGNEPYELMTFAQAHGGTGTFFSYDAAHAVDYSGPMAFLEGEHYLGEAARSHIEYCCAYTNFNQFSHDGGLRYEGTVLGNSWGVPTSATRRDGQGLNQRQQTREGIWGINVLRAALLVTPDGMPEQPLLVNELRRLEKWMTDSWSYFSPAFRELGCTFAAQGWGLVQPWQVAFAPQVYYMLHRLMHDALSANARGFASGLAEAAVLDGRFVLNFVREAPMQAYRALAAYSFDVDMLEPVPSNLLRPGFDCVVANDVWTTSFGDAGTGWVMTNGDVIHMSPRDNIAVNLPAPLQLGVPYYVINASGTSFQISTTPNGPPVTGVPDRIILTLQRPSIFVSRTVLEPSGQFHWPNGDGYMLITHACLEAMRGNGHPDYAQELQDMWATFMGPWLANPPNLYSPWLWDGSLLGDE